MCLTWLCPRAESLLVGKGRPWERTGGASGGEALLSDPCVCAVGSPGSPGFLSGQVGSTVLIPGCPLLSCLLASPGVCAGPGPGPSLSPSPLTRRKLHQGVGLHGGMLINGC